MPVKKRKLKRTTKPVKRPVKGGGIFDFLASLLGGGLKRSH